jgi:hypothetical protein
MIGSAEGFEEKWRAVYSWVAAGKEGKPGEYLFGVRERFALKRVGDYTVVRNVVLGRKRTTGCIVEALEQKATFLDF